VHGYYTSFEAAARQAGQLAFDLEIDRDLRRAADGSTAGPPKER
jgi:hypothetical protein